MLLGLLFLFSSFLFRTAAFAVFIRGTGKANFIDVSLLLCWQLIVLSPESSKPEEGFLCQRWMHFSSSHSRPMRLCQRLLFSLADTSALCVSPLRWRNSCLHCDLLLLPHIHHHFSSVLISTAGFSFFGPVLTDRLGRLG